MASVGGRRSPQDSSDESFRLECSPCKYEGVTVAAQHFCPECGDYLCETCQKAHRALSITRNHRLVSGNKMPKKEENSNDLNVPRVVLCSCNAKEVTIFCEDHNEIICANCKLLQHRYCKTVDISDKCIDIELSSSETTHTTVLELKEKLETLQKTRNEDMEELASQGDRARETVKSFRRELNEQLDRLEEQSLADIDQCVRKQKLPILEHIDTVDAAINKLESDNLRYQAARIVDDERISFIQNFQLSKTIDQIKSVIESVRIEVQEPIISFESDQSLKLTSAPTLGKINSSSIKETRKAVGEMKIVFTTQKDVKINADTIDPVISGSAFMPYGELVLSDYNNRKLKVLKVDLSLKENLTLPSRPWDLSVMNKREIVVALPDNKSLLFVTVYPLLQCGSSVKFDQACRSVQVNGEEIYVLFDNGEIKIIDRAGTQQKNIYSTFSFTSFLSYVDIDSDGLCVSEHNAHTIRGFNNGREIYKYTDPQLKYPLGVYIDGHQNVLACGYSSNNIHVIDKSGKQVKILLSANDGVRRPYTLSFRENDDTLVVAGNSMKLLVCKMQ